MAEQRIPKSYKDPFWQKLAAEAERKANLPAGLLSSIVVNGERTDNDRVSEAGAKTVFQIIPETRAAIKKKYGIDAYSSPQAAADAAALLLKESLKRNNNDVNLAVAEYHGGVNRANWGPKTRAYVDRVVGQPQEQQQPQTTFERMKARREQAQPPSIAAVYQAYQSGQMTPEEEAQFEADVNAGLVMLPRGATLAGQKSAGPLDKPEPIVLPEAITHAYRAGQLTDDERDQLESDMRAGLVKLPATLGDLAPDDSGDVAPTEQGIIQRPEEASLMDEAIGTAEAIATMGTGMAGGIAGGVGGLLFGTLDNIEQGTFGTPEGERRTREGVSRMAESMTYTPRTQAGQRLVADVAETLNLLPVTPLTAEMGAVSQSLRAARPVLMGRGSAAVNRAAAAVKPPVVATVEAVRAPVAATVNAVKAAPRRAAVALGMAEPEPAPVAGRGGSVGAAGVEPATMRAVMGEELPVPVELTKGQATRDFAQQQFEREAAKNPELGAPIRQRMSDQARAVRQSLDIWIDETGAQEPDLRGVGTAIDKAIRESAAKDKTKIRVAYKEAEKAGELEDPVQLNSVADYLNKNRAEREESGLMTKVQRQIDAMEVGSGSFENGTLRLAEMTLRQAEDLRKFINRAVKKDDANEIRIASELKELIDASTESLGGQKYRTARALRADYAKRYENRAVVSDLIKTKRGMDDRKVALEDVADRIVFSGSLDDLKHAGRVLKTGGPQGRQAWKELQGHVISKIKEAATRGVATDETGGAVISPAGLNKIINQLDREGKLEYLFGNVGANKLRALNDLAKVMFTAPPGSVNTSNTASILLATMDLITSANTGMPLPIASGLRMVIKNVKEKKLKARINDALFPRGANNQQEQQQ